MIERYSRKEIRSIWEDKNKYSLWLKIELIAAEAMERINIIPRGVSKKIKSKARVNVKRILQIEDKVKHDVIAFLTSISEKVGDDGKFLYYDHSSTSFKWTATIPGYYSLADWKTLIAASTDFADFQSRVAAL